MPTLRDEFNTLDDWHDLRCYKTPIKMLCLALWCERCGRTRFIDRYYARLEDVDVNEPVSDLYRPFDDIFPLEPQHDPKCYMLPDARILVIVCERCGAMKDVDGWRKHLHKRLLEEADSMV